MRVLELISILNKLPPNLEVTIWDAGNRANLASVDDSFIYDDYPFVELNTDTDDGKHFIVRNHNGTELGRFNTRDMAVEEAKFYREQTGNPAYIEEQLA